VKEFKQLRDSIPSCRGGGRVESCLAAMLKLLSRKECHINAPVLGPRTDSFRYTFPHDSQKKKNAPVGGLRYPKYRLIIRKYTYLKFRMKISNVVSEIWTLFLISVTGNGTWVHHWHQEIIRWKHSGYQTSHRFRVQKHNTKIMTTAF
jgi:hypothetical protein